MFSKRGSIPKNIEKCGKKMKISENMLKMRVIILLLKFSNKLYFLYYIKKIKF